ncbi:hypothetical protein BDV23DRAFT_164534 [Aspergillus alliaceus]|uniref:Nitronate monooxygenase domain-containing protein n=1 Tax=Petromyces alliaceus TaxID=209559 RepID=A0A5N7BVP1_PETAA|nr:hypothetical protein BDV23DRAFT_164534 [Aspergillus alliaceus]
MAFHQSASSLDKDYPWTSSPLIASAPMAKVAKPELAVAVSKGGGLGFIAAGYTSDNLEDLLEGATQLLKKGDNTLTPAQANPADPTILPVGVGFITWSASLKTAIPALRKYRPCAVWLFAPPTDFHDLATWATEIRAATSQRTKIWVQIGSVADAVEVVTHVAPDVLVVQGCDAGGHSLARGASIVSLVPEVHDKLRELRPKARNPIRLVATGGISDGRGVAAAIMLGAEGCVLGTRFLASPESLIAEGYQKEVLRASDGGVSTVRTTIYDKVRDIHGWPDSYDGRGLINRTYTEAVDGLGEDENRELYLEELEKGDRGYGPEGRLTTYAGTGVGLVKRVMPAREIVISIREEANQILGKALHRSKL